jgi:hypothetical protein
LHLYALQMVLQNLKIATSVLTTISFSRGRAPFILPPSTQTILLSSRGQ